jgi:RNA polymerase sigma-70 factor (ECF subfamily)
MQVTDERQLVRRMLDSEERAFHAFFDDFFPRVFRFALPRVGRDHEAAKEVVQATLIKAMRGLASYRGEAALFTWVCQICRREIVNYLRESRRDNGRVVLIEDSSEVRAALESIEAPEMEQPANLYTADETRRLVRSVLDRLPGSYGDALEWKYVEGMSVEEISARLGISQTAAQSLLARARIAFRDALEAVFGSGARDVLAQLGEV